MKILFLGDLHFGARDDSAYFFEKQLDFFDKLFFPYIEENKIDAIVQLGDMFERRKFTNNRTLSIVMDRILNKMDSIGIPIITIVGNHDTYYKNTNKINTLELFIKASKFKNFQVINKVTEWNDFLLVPWINNENAKESIELIESNTTCRFCCGHFEIKTFLMSSGYESKTGLNPSTFKMFEHVFSGHYHINQSKKNIHYVGTPYQLTWSDYGVDKRFIVFDTDTQEIEEVFNPYDIYRKFNWKSRPLSKENIEDIHNKIVKLYVTRKEPESDSELNAYISLLEKANVHNFEIINTDNSIMELTNESLEVDDTRKLIDMYFNILQIPEEEMKITKKTFMMLYNRALTRMGEMSNEN